MKKHHLIFNKIKELLQDHYNGELEICDNEDYLVVGDSGLWISSDEREITIGYGPGHTHYDSEYNDLKDAVIEFFYILTERVKVTNYLKGSYIFKTKTEIEISESECYNLGTSSQIFFPYWKKTEEKVTFYKPIIDKSIIKKEYKEILNIVELN